MQKARDRREREFVFNEYKVLLLQDGKSSKDLLYNDVNTLNTT